MDLCLEEEKMKSWWQNKWGIAGVILMLILNATGALLAFPLFQAFGALFLLGTFPLLLAIIVPLLFGGWFLGLLAEKIWRTFT